MSRDIKFRAWDKQSKYFIHNFSLTSNGIINQVSCGFFKGIGNYILMQFTGLKDKNGKEIYESDISEYPWNDNKILMKVIFVDGEFRLSPIKKYSFKIWDIRICGENDILEIIGNIYQNPELLEQNN